jgi:hypothetical protein
MAVTTRDIAVSTSGFITFATSADWSGAEVVKAAPGAGKALCIRQLTIVSTANITCTIGEDENAGAVATPRIGPMTLNSVGTIPLVFNPPWRLGSNASLVCDASGAGEINLFVQGSVD